MLVTREQMIAACELDAAGVAAAMQAGGYTDEKFVSVKFCGVNSQAKFVYRTTYVEDGEECAGLVFLQYGRGSLEQGWYLIGDY